MDDKLRDLIHAAYADCNGMHEKGVERNLDFKAPKSVGGAEAMGLMDACCPYGYNGFNSEVMAEVVKKFGDNAAYTIAREGSPCLYIKPVNRVWLNRDESILKLADEVSFEPSGTFRLWWD